MINTKEEKKIIKSRFNKGENYSLRIHLLRNWEIIISLIDWKGKETNDRG